MQPDRPSTVPPFVSGCSAASLARIVLAGLMLSCIFTSRIMAEDVERFPRPEFRETDYAYPTNQHPLARAEVFEYIDLAVLVLALGLGALFALRVRSRAALVTLSVLSVLYFGFWRLGCICPIGSTQNVAYAAGNPDAALPWTMIAWFVLPLAVALVAGRIFCSAVCPIGAVQELLLVRPVRVPDWLDRPLRVLPYIYLALAILFAATGAGFLICRYDPVVGIFRLSALYEVALLTGGLVVLALFVGRPYCRYACPYGALLNLASRLSKWHASITPDRCVNCRLCEDACPYGAIVVPDTKPLGERRPRERTILLAILIATPLLMILGGWTGTRLSGYVATAHPLIQTADAVRAEGTRSDEGRDRYDAFRQEGLAREALFTTERETRDHIEYASMLAGIFMGLATGCSLLILTIRRKRDGYEPDRGYCVSCGRCFASCPRDTAVREARAGQRETAE